MESASISFAGVSSLALISKFCDIVLFLFSDQAIVYKKCLLMFLDV